MTKFPDDYKRHLLDHSGDIIEIAFVLQGRNLNLSLFECCEIVAKAHLDTTLSLLYNSIKFDVSQPVRKIK